ncbi:hypothetical protein MK851_15485, partial [Tenacibaculum sp. 1B UA]|nr:hypothetical protein [Tenacibaculum sp. 1B UA]
MMKNYLFNLLLIVVAFFSLKTYGQCDVGSFVVTSQDATCSANGVISVSVPNATNCSGWNVILKLASGSEVIKALPANGGPVEFTSLSGGDYEVRLFNGIQTINYSNNPITITSLYNPMVIKTSTTRPSCNADADFYTPNATLTLSVQSGGTGPFQYELLDSNGNVIHTSGITSNRSHTFENFSGGEEFIYRVTDQPGVAGCEVSIGQEISIPVSGFSSMYNSFVRFEKDCSGGDCNKNIFNYVIFTDGIENVNALQQHSTISINGAPAVPLTLRKSNYNARYLTVGQELNPGDQVQVHLQDACNERDVSFTVPDLTPRFDVRNVTTKFNTDTCKDEFRVNFYSIGTLAKVTGDLESEISFDAWCTPNSVSVEYEDTPGNWISVGHDQEANDNQIKEVLLTDEIVYDKNYRFTANDGCTTLSDEFFVSINRKPKQPIDNVSGFVGNGVLEGTASFALTGVQGLGYPLTITVTSPTHGNSVTINPTQPETLAGSYQIDFPFTVTAESSAQRIFVGDLPPGTYNVKVVSSSTCQGVSEKNLSFDLINTVGYIDPSVETIPSCSDKNTLMFSMNPTHGYASQGLVEVFIDNGDGTLGQRRGWHYLTTNTLNKATFIDLPSGDYVAVYSANFGNYAITQYSAALKRNGSFKWQLKGSVTYGDIVLSGSQVSCGDGSGIATVSIIEGTPVYPLTYEIFSQSDPNTILETYTANDESDPNISGYTFASLPNGEYSMRVTSSFCTTKSFSVSIGGSSSIPEIVASDTTPCKGDTITLGIPISTSTWDIVWKDDADQVIATNVNSIEVTPQTTTLYKVEYKIKDQFGCGSASLNTDDIQITTFNELTLEALETTQCANDGSGYTLTAVVLGNNDSVEATGTGAPGTWVTSGNRHTWTSDLIVAGTDYNVSFQDKNACNTLPITGSSPVCCVFEVSCPTFPTTSVNCVSDLPANGTITEAEFESLGNGDGVIGDIPCGVIEIVADNGTLPSCNGEVTRTYTVTEYEDTNNNGIRDNGEGTVLNSQQCIQTITVQDTVAPTGTAPSDITVACMSDVPAADGAAVLDESDNCSGAVTVTVSDTDNGGSGCNDSPLVITRTYTLTDCGGLTTELVQIITVQDTETPTGTAPSDITVACISDVPAADGAAVLDESDNCGGAVTVTVSDTDNGGSGCNDSPLVIT